MSTLAEIEEAIEHLPAEELSRLEAVLRRRMLARQDEAGLAELERANGFDVLPRREGAAVSSEDVRRLCAEEGI